jgi:hypothetical protein
MSGLGSLSSWFRFSHELVSLHVVGFHILLRPPSSTAIFYGFFWYCSAWRESSHKGSREGENQGEFPHTVFSTSSIISAFMCRSLPFEVDFIFVGFWSRKNRMSNLSVAVALCNCSLRKCSGITFRFLLSTMFGFRPAIAYVGELSLPCSDFPPVYVLELRRQFSDYGVLFILFQILRRKNRKV